MNQRNKKWVKEREDWVRGPRSGSERARTGFIGSRSGSKIARIGSEDQGVGLPERS